LQTDNVPVSLVAKINPENEWKVSSLQNDAFSTNEENFLVYAIAKRNIQNLRSMPLVLSMRSSYPRRSIAVSHHDLYASNARQAGTAPYAREHRKIEMYADSPRGPFQIAQA
jgi:hypothetical protein